MTIRYFCICSIVLLSCSAGIAQKKTAFLESHYYGTASWNEDSLGNHRVVVKVDKKASAVRAQIPWRRRDLNPELKGIRLVDEATGAVIKNAVWRTVNREFGEVTFEPQTAPGQYFVYYLLYRSKGRNYPKGSYLPPEETANSSWLASLPDWNSLPEVQLVQFQSIDSFNSFYPMEIIATADEVQKLLQKHPTSKFLLFSESRSNPIKMTTDIPAKWILDGPMKPIESKADKGEFFAFQIGAFAAREEVTGFRILMTDLRSKTGKTIPSSALSSFNTAGTDWQGRSFEKPLRIGRGRVQGLWMGIMVPETADAGTYEGTITVEPEGMPSSSIPVSLSVSDRLVEAHGDNDPFRLTRLRWLNSSLAMDDDIVPPFTALQVDQNTISCLGRSLTINQYGLPKSILSYFSPEVTMLRSKSREMLSGAAELAIQTPGGEQIAWTHKSLSITKKSPGAVQWKSENTAGDFDILIQGQMEFDGYVDFQVTFTARKETNVEDIRLLVPMSNTIARYMMGMGVKGGNRPAQFQWTWDEKRNQDAVWLGDVNAGFQLSFRDQNYVRPLNTNFYLSKPLNMPSSWFNGGKGGFRFESVDGSTLLLQAFSGSRTIMAGEKLHYNFAFLITPFKLIETDAQWQTRFYHRFVPLDTIAATGANTINVHHATAINPYINYPFLRPMQMKSYIDSAHQRGFKVKIYYTVRELSNRAPELFALRSMGEEVLSYGSGGGFSWLQEHLDSNYIAAWFVPELKDAAVINSGVSRWHNYYVEGLNWLVRNVGIDGLYIDDVAFDRTTMKRVRKVLDRNRPGALIDLHSANQFNPSDGFANSANLYLEHFPYIDRLWFGEYFDYNSAPDFWLIETSGIPFGLMGEMLEKGGNPWRGMIYGMTSRLPWAGNPAPLWKAWDEFGITGSAMIGYWSPNCPVRTDNANVLATAYVKEGKTLISLASWNAGAVSVRLTIDWSALGLDPATSLLVAPEIQDFQHAAAFRPDERIAIEPGRGWLLIAEPVYKK